MQAVAFVMPGAPQPDALAIWSLLNHGEGPESFQRPSGAPNAVSTAAGPEGSTQLVVTSQIGRIDIVRHGRGAPGANEPPSLDSLEDAVQAAVAQLKQVLEIGPIFRIAIVASLSVNAEAGFSDVFANIATGVAFPKNATDCIYQLNVRRNSGAASDIEINRLCTWSSGEKNLLLFNISGPGLQSTAASPMTMKSIPIVNFNVDVNTATGPGFRIEAENSALVDELAAEVLGLAKSGAEALQ